MEHALILALAVLAVWDVGRRFAEAGSNRVLERRVAALESADTLQRVANLETQLTAVKNQVETMRSARGATGSRWGA